MSEAAIVPTEVPRPLDRRAATRQNWLERLARFPSSGLSPAQFCAAEGISLPSFYAWKRRLRAEALEPATAPSSDAVPGPRLLPVRLSLPTATVELVLPGGAVLRLAPGCDLAFVRSLLNVLGGKPC